MVILDVVVRAREEMYYLDQVTVATAKQLIDEIDRLRQIIKENGYQNTESKGHEQ
jgi:hypothetical protein